MDSKALLVGILVFVILSLIIAIILALADKFLHVEEDNRVEEVRKLLPGLDCGMCGYPSCQQFATALITGDTTKISGCKVSTKEKHLEIYEFLKATPDKDGNVLEVEI